MARQIVVTLIILTMVFAILFMASLGLFIWQLIRVTKETDDLQMLYPGFFRTEQEQLTFIQTYKPEKYIPPTINWERCSLTCEGFPFNYTTPAPDPTFDSNDQTSRPANLNATDSSKDPFSRETTELKLPSNQSQSNLTTKVPPQTIGSTVASMQTESTGLPPDTSTPQKDPSSFSLPAGRKRRRRSEDEGDSDDQSFIFHGCCYSREITSTPENGETLSGDVVDLVQNVLLKQYFQEEECRQFSDCGDCVCSNIPKFQLAVYHKDRNAKKISQRYGVTLIKLNGCCKCLNLARRGS